MQKNIARWEMRPSSNPDLQEGELLDHLLSKKDAAQQIGIHYRTIERWYNQGFLDRYRIGGRYFYDRKAIFMLASSPTPRCEAKSNRFQAYLETLRKR